ncbi:MAG: M15 family metallopeptidase [Selenomonadaceae bacterium]|nr:M15 family metallopeptidase [Selenomonadaceae bacterium]
MQELYEANYPIEKIRLVDKYNADDETSMRDNNSSCFDFRFISNTTKVSKHGFGLAVDINTLYNPYIKVVNGKRILEPATAEKYNDKSKKFSYKIEKKIFAINCLKSTDLNGEANRKTEKIISILKFRIEL